MAPADATSRQLNLAGEMAAVGVTACRHGPAGLDDTKDATRLRVVQNRASGRP